MTGARVTYDETANAAYVYLTEPRARVTSARTYPCDPVDVDGVINLDFDDQGRLVGIRCWRPVRNCPSTCSSPRSDWTPTAHDRLSVVGHRISFSKTPPVSAPTPWGRAWIGPTSRSGPGPWQVTRGSASASGV
ncbi:DUF2283 domain-containing protein [Streptomyces sp. ME08-AFT2]|uniref:DUF2283 domain-containing protein n=1 Tax=Streptomyces sp. ME08-AFT2 TaxID=3028683 RepID=UPI0029A8B3F9|nr:DUF2283 domain-containing protein [Streptomyces sp. ME08-AFT2]MDX3315154.1 DUF2283 domain-containing protein [Streptomyces sp. ME08-AFT2]